MRTTALLAASVCVAGILVPSAAAAPAPAATSKVIVELRGTPALAGIPGAMTPAARARVNSRANALRTQHARFRDRLSHNGIHAKVRADFTQALDAVALSVPAADVAKLRALPGVAAVFPDARLQASVDPDVSVINAPQVWQQHDPSGRPEQGAGETVAVLDTGIDYNDPDLGGGFGAGHKVVGGYDFVNDDADPMDDNGHGTHVAGIIAGDAAEPGGRTGVAPQASLTAYKVLDANGYGDESTIIEGLEAAISANNPHRADVVNMSLSGSPAPNDPLEAACEQAIRDGVVVVVAAGNDGPGESTVGSPAEAPDVLAVGASITGVDVPTVTVTAPVHHALAVQRLGLSANPPAGGEDLDVIDVGGGQPSDYDGVDATGKAVLIAYNPCFLTQSITTAEQHGAAALLYYTPNYYSLPGHQPGPALPDFAAGDDPDKLAVPAVVLNGTDATDVQQWLAAGSVRIHLGSADATDQIAAFSAHGPALGSYALKPDIVAPGVEIGSTWLGGTYRDDSGTSMAAPHVAGAAALVRQAHPDWTAAQVAAALTGGAHRLAGYDAVTQGAGRLDVAASADLGLLASPRVADLGLADLAHGDVSASTTITLSNMGDRASTVFLDAQPGPGAAARVDVTPRIAYVRPGGTVAVHLTVHTANTGTATDITGWLRARAYGTPELTVPYLLAERSLALHADPDPSSGPSSTVYVAAQPSLAAAPTVTVTDPYRHTTTVTATYDHPGWWRAAVPAHAAGTYRVTASAPAASGVTITGATTFEELGAGSAKWQPAGPISEGAAVVATTSLPGRIYAMPTRSPHAGLFRTDDGGATWHELHNLPVGDGSDMGLVADPTDPDTVYLLVAGNPGIDPTYQGKVLVSHDAGATWTTLPFPDVAPHGLAIDSTGAILTVPAFNGNVYVSTDHGTTWTAFTSPGGFPSAARVIGHDLYIATGNGLYVIHSVDATPSAPQLILTPPISYQGVEDVVGDGHVLVARTITQSFISRDAGATWQPLFDAPSGEFLTTLSIVTGDIYLASSRHIWVDRGEGTAVTTLPTPVAQDTFQIASLGNELVVDAENNGIYLTTDDGASYQRVGIAGASVNALAVTRNAGGNSELLAGTAFDVYETPVPEGAVADQDWGPVNTGIGKGVVSLAVDPANPQIVYRVVANAFSRFDIDKSTDGGATWTGLEQARVSARAYQVLVDPVDPNFVYVTLDDGLSPGVLVSRDGGATWRKNDLPMQVTAIAADPHNADRIWLGGPSGLYLSTDEGQTVTRLSSTPVTAIAVDPHDARHLVVGGDGIYVSSNGGRTLTAAHAAPYRMDITALAFAANGTLYAATGAFHDGSGLPVGGRGVLASRDGGRMWQNVSAGLGNLDVASLALAPDGRWLYAGTQGGSVYRMPL